MTNSLKKKKKWHKLNMRLKKIYSNDMKSHLYQMTAFAAINFLCHASEYLNYWKIFETLI